MSRPVIRVSAWALEELRRRAVVERRTVVAVLDEVLGRPVSVAPQPAAVAPAVSRTVEPDAPSGLDAALTKPAVTMAALALAPFVDPARCPSCGCARVSHQAGASGVRCERHPTCRWETAG